MKKSHAYIQIILRIIHSPSQRVSEKELAESLNKPYSTFKRYLSELGNIILDDGNHAITKESIDGVHYYSLNKSMFKYFYPEHLESAFYFEAYQKIGVLLENSSFSEDVEALKKEVFKLNGKSEQFSRKFFYNSATTSEKIDIKIQNIIVQSLIENKKIGISYQEKTYILKPLCMTQYRDSLYLIAFNDSDETRCFKLNRIQSIDLQEDIFTYPCASTWCPKTFFKEASGIITGEVKNVCINVYGYTRQHIKEREFFNKKHLGSNDQFDTYRLSYTNDDEFLGQLFVYAQDIQIIDNNDLRQKLINKASEAIKKNSYPKAA